jgi:hypothetical protein
MKVTCEKATIEPHSYKACVVVECQEVNGYEEIIAYLAVKFGVKKILACFDDEDIFNHYEQRKSEY